MKPAIPFAHETSPPGWVLGSRLRQGSKRRRARLNSSSAMPRPFAQADVVVEREFRHEYVPRGTFEPQDDPPSGTRRQG